MSAGANEQVIHDFYASFQRRDAQGMAACYDAGVVFSDPVFPNLVGAHAGAMWAMLCGRSKDLSLTYASVTATDTEGSAAWRAIYTFTATGRRVENIVHARFEFRSGKITRHVDSFDFWRWSRQALGLKGTLLGWTPIVRGAVQKRAAAQLAEYERSAGT
jgi:ketosteroid isomerase-like protein